MSKFKEYEDSFERDVDILKKEHDKKNNHIMTKYK